MSSLNLRQSPSSVYEATALGIPEKHQHTHGIHPRLISLMLNWQLVTTEDMYTEPGAWLYEASYIGVRVAFGYNPDCGPGSWVGHATEDKWLSFFSAATEFDVAAYDAVVTAHVCLKRADDRRFLGLEALA